MSNDTRFISRLDAARLIGVNPRTIDRAILDGRLTKHTRGSGYYVYLDRAQVEQFKIHFLEIAVAK